MRAHLPVLGAAIAAAVFAGLLLLESGSGRQQNSADSDLLRNAPEATGTSSISDCEPNCETPLPSETVAATPCPYCGQDTERWRAFTNMPPPELLGTSAVLLEGSCDAVIFGQRWRERRQPASLAKIATAMVVVENAALTDVVDIELTGWDLVVENDSTIMGLMAGMQMTVEELLYGLLLSSGNDAALELSRHLGGEARVIEQMNQRSAALGLTDTRLRNSHGLDAPNAYTTPFDMAILGSELLRIPVLRDIVATEFWPAAWHELAGLWNGNYLLYIYEDAIGVKTGYTEGAGWSIVSAASREGRLLIASVFNSADVYWDSMRLFDWAYDNTSSVC